MVASLVWAGGHRPGDFLKAIEHTPDEGQRIVAHFCSNCHAKKPLIPVGAPRMGVKSDWQNRLKAGFEMLFKHTDEGFNAMPPRGGCFECSDRQLIEAILVLLPDEEKKEQKKLLKKSKKTTS